MEQLLNLIKAALKLQDSDTKTIYYLLPVKDNIWILQAYLEPYQTPIRELFFTSSPPVTLQL